MQKILNPTIMRSLKRSLALAMVTSCAAAVFAAPPPPPVYYPDILVTGMSTAIYDGSVQPLKLDDTYFGKAQLGVHSWEHTFEIRNFGDADLLLTGPVSLSGENAGDFVITRQPLQRIPPGQRTSFAIRYTPSFDGKAHATVHIPNNDPDEAAYDFAIRGDGTSAPLVGPDLKGELVFYKNYKCVGIPLLACKMNGRVDVQNLSTDYDLNWATVRVYVVKGDVLNDSAHLVAQKTVKKLKRFIPGKNNKPKRIKFKGYVPPGYTHIYAEVVPEDGSEDVNYTNNRTAYLYGL